MDSEDLAQHIRVLSDMQKELKEMQVALKERIDGLELQQEELRQYHSQVIRALSTFRALLEQEQRQEQEGSIEGREQ